MVDLLVKILPDICADLMVDEMDRIFVSAATSEWATALFCEMMEKHPDLYAENEKFIEIYFKILSHDVKQVKQMMDVDGQQQEVSNILKNLF